MDAREIAEWQAFEHVHGPLDRAYSDDMLAQIHEQLQFLAHVMGVQVWGEQNPVPAPRKVPRPANVFDPEWRSESFTEGDESDSVSREQFDAELAKRG